MEFVKQMPYNLESDLLFSESGLNRGADEIWYAAEQETVSYPSERNGQCFEIEDQSFWFKHRNACIVEMVLRFLKHGKCQILDIGGGNTFVDKWLLDVGWDVGLLEPSFVGVRAADGAPRRKNCSHSYLSCKVPCKLRPTLFNLLN